MKYKFQWLLTAFCIFIASSTQMFAEGEKKEEVKAKNNETIVKYKSWTILNGTEKTSLALRGATIVDTVQYISSHESLHHYRQEDDKVYRYNTVDSCEQLLFDYGLHVGDTFALYENFNLVVEAETDTSLVTKTMDGKIEKLHRCIHLRGVEDPSFIDTWVEGLGSLFYGIFRPTTKERIPDQHLFVCTAAEEVVMLPLYIGNYSGADTNLNTDLVGDSTILNFAFKGDSLHIYGYYRTNCSGELYCLALQSGSTVELFFSEYRSAANCFDYHAIDFKLPGFTQDSYTILYDNKKTTTGIEQPLFFNPDTPYYDLQGRKVVSPTRGIYIRNGNKVVIK